MQPNILFIFPDQWRGDCLSCAGHSAVETPFLDQLAAEGTRFTSAYTPSPTCVPARACLATGRRPVSTGRLGYRDGNPWPYANTYMRVLRDGGYQTLCSGKTHFYPPRARLGFEELELYETPAQDMDHPSDYHQWLAKETGGLVRDTCEELDSNAWLAHPWTQPEHLHPNAWTTTTAIEMLERRDPTRPYFLQVAYHRPHPPHDPPIEFYNRHQGTPLPDIPIGDWAAEDDAPLQAIDSITGKLPQRKLDRTRHAYFAQIEHIDYQIGRLFRYLRARKLLDDTWIVFSSDHGEMLGDHHRYRKTCPFEGSAHIPLIIRAPKNAEAFPEGQTCDIPVSLEDISATLVEIGSQQIPADYEGHSLLPQMKDASEPAKRDYIHGEHAPNWQYLTDGKEKFAWDTITDEHWFFDLEEDPQELTNLAAREDQAERVQVWEQRLIEILKDRPEDDLSDGTKLKGGKRFEKTRTWLENGQSSASG